ncbi:MAG TPA: HepT-like ribonuclease domain-containing protein [bacterium]|jgi:uncharacterized protein with HEPN domain
MPRDETYLLYMLLAARRVVRSTSQVSRAEFDSNVEKMDSVVLQIGNIGEAASHISSEYCNLHPMIPWGEIIGMRHRVFHGYEVIDWNKVWDTATISVPKLIPMIEPLVPPEEET